MKKQIYKRWTQKDFDLVEGVFNSYCKKGFKMNQDIDKVFQEIWDKTTSNIAVSMLMTSLTPMERKGLKKYAENQFEKEIKIICKATQEAYKAELAGQIH